MERIGEASKTEDGRTATEETKIISTSAATQGVGNDKQKEGQSSGFSELYFQR
jgi:hypothetical protein